MRNLVRTDAEVGGWVDEWAGRLLGKARHASTVNVSELESEIIDESRRLIRSGADPQQVYRQAKRARYAELGHFTHHKVYEAFIKRLAKVTGQ